MKVAVLCEFSGIVRDAFIARGHDAISCDLLPSEAPGPHIEGDCLEHDWSGFDLLITHPPCTHLAVSGARWFKGKEGKALDFVRQLLALPVARIALENPISIISSRICSPDQIIQPWQFGHPEVKTTCLWLKGLPPLQPTHSAIPDLFAKDAPTGRTPRVHREPPGPDRWKNRSRTYPGIAAAMAEQWGAA